MFAIRKRRRNGPPTCAGSHLDTQPTGGRYDGIFAVCAGVEMLKVLKENKFETEFPIGNINWTNEEGARFPISMCSSGVWAGMVTLEKAYNLQEVGDGKQTIAQELQRIGYLGEMEASHQAMPIGAHFELHIEQGPRLEKGNNKIGIVQGVQAYRWHTITVKGRACRTGTTDFAHRADAMLAAAKMILHSHRLASKYCALASTGILKLSPGSTNTVPGLVQFSLDIRSSEDKVLTRLEEQLKHGFARIASNEFVNDINEGGTLGDRCTVKWCLDAPTEAVKFDKDCIRCVHDSAKDLFGDKYVALTQNLTSGAGHDSVRDPSPYEFTCWRLYIQPRSLQAKRCQRP
ncbi:MAG: hypothetical protein Q9164_000089 [Protoblastenia rupestris]